MLQSDIDRFEDEFWKGLQKREGTDVRREKTRTCPGCGGAFTPQGLGAHRRWCDKTPQGDPDTGKSGADVTAEDTTPAPPAAESPNEPPRLIVYFGEAHLEATKTDANRFWVSYRGPLYEHTVRDLFVSILSDALGRKVTAI